MMGRFSNRRVNVVCGLFLGWLAATGPVSAAPTMFFGEDPGLGETQALGSFPNATSAFNDFISNLSLSGSESFEGFALNQTAPLNLSFSGLATALLAGNGDIRVVMSGTNGGGQYPTDGSHFYAASNTFSVNFSQPINAFGFMAVDVGDFDGQLTVATVGTLNQSFVVPNSVNVSGGAVLFWGFFDPNNTVNSLTIGNTGGGGDNVGVDQFTIGVGPQAAPTAVPEANTFALIVIGVLCLIISHRLRNLSSPAGVPTRTSAGQKFSLPR